MGSLCSSFVKWVRSDLCSYRYKPLLELEKAMIELFKEAAVYAEAAYQETDALKHAFVKNIAVGTIICSSLQEIKIFKGVKTDVAGYMTATPEKILIVFRGTDSVNDWRINFKVVEAPFELDTLANPVYVHKGFKQQYDEIRNEVRKYVAENCVGENQKRILITGHSLGGALASLCALDLAWNWRQPWLALITQPQIDLVTFGAPPVGVTKFPAALKLKVPNTHRLRMAWDLVPKVPISLLGYSHIDRGIKLREGCNTFSGLVDAHGMGGYKKGTLKTSEFWDKHKRENC